MLPERGELQNNNVLLSLISINNFVTQCDSLEPNWQWAMYGPNYARLSAIKAKYDPDELLWCRRCVGSEKWVYDDTDGSLCQRSLGDVWPNYAY
jgi:hypothetical protein